MKIGTLGIGIYRELPGDRSLWLVWFVLAMFSLLAVYSAAGSLAWQARGGDTEFYLLKQFVFVMIGGVLTWYFAGITYTEFGRWAPYMLILACILMIYTAFFGLEINDARRWIEIPFTGQTFQTSDFAKLALITVLAKMIANRQEVIKSGKEGFVPLIIPVLVVCGLIAPADLSTAGMIFITCLFMMFVGRVSLKYIALVIGIGMLSLVLLGILGTTFPEYIRTETWVNRIMSFLGSEESVYQVQQAKIAIANGEWFGVHPGNSVQRNVLPSAYSDFIYAIICEEYGILGAGIVIALYTWLLFHCVRLVTRFQKTFGSMLAIGLAFNIVIQAYFNIAVSVNLVPVTGLTLPMISMGGTSLLFTCAAFGMILSVSRSQREYVEAEKASNGQRRPGRDLT